MEWVETTAKTVEGATDQALDQLGVDRDDAEIEVLEEPKNGLFGRVRSDARVRARVRPTKPRAKDDKKRSPRASGEPPAKASKEAAPAVASAPTQPTIATPATSPAVSVGPRVRTGLSVDEVAERFLAGLLEAFGLEGTVERHEVAEGLVEYRVVGHDLGVLIGPKAQTLTAIQELLRTVVHYEAEGHTGRVLLDVAGYRQRRRAALEDFTRKVAADVVASGERRALEPMNAADRKVIHDATNDIAGVSSMSEGEDPNRRVVLLPA